MHFALNPSFMFYQCLLRLLPLPPRLGGSVILSNSNIVAKGIMIITNNIHILFFSFYQFS